MAQLTITESNLPRRAYTPPAVSSEIHDEPADNDRHGAVTAACDHEQSSVLDLAVFNPVHVQQDPESCHGDQHGDDGKCESMAQLIGQDCDEH